MNYHLITILRSKLKTEYSEFTNVYLQRDQNTFKRSLKINGKKGL
jgi:hypothetical protein